MYLERKGHSAKASTHLTYTELFDYLGKVTDVFAASSIKRDYHLSDTERAWFIVTLIVIIHGYKHHTSNEAIQIYKKYFSNKANRGTILDRINKISKKKWLIYVKEPEKKLKIPPFFETLFENFEENKDVIDFRIRINYEQGENNRPDLAENVPIELNS